MGDSPQDLLAGEEEVLDLDDVVRVLKTSKAQVAEWRQSGKLPCVRFGHKTVRYLRSDVVELVKSSRDNKGAA